MRMVLMLVSILFVATLIIKGYSSSLSNVPETQVGTGQNNPRDKAREVDQIILDVADTQKRALEQQLQQ